MCEADSTTKDQEGSHDNDTDTIVCYSDSGNNDFKSDYENSETLFVPDETDSDSDNDDSEHLYHQNIVCSSHQTWQYYIHRWVIYLQFIWFP